jgi:hypothetical protein
LRAFGVTNEPPACSTTLSEGQRQPLTACHFRSSFIVRLSWKLTGSKTRTTHEALSTITIPYHTIPYQSVSRRIRLLLSSELCRVCRGTLLEGILMSRSSGLAYLDSCPLAMAQPPSWICADIHLVRSIISRARHYDYDIAACATVWCDC